MKEQIIEMVGNGIPAHNVAQALGVSDSYVSQVLSEEGIAEQIVAKKAAKINSGFKRDELLDAAEQAALEKVQGLIFAITNPSVAASVYRTLNAAKRTINGPSNAIPVSGAAVHLHLPAQAAIKFTMSSDKQVVEVDGRSLVTMPAQSLVKRLENRKAIQQLGLKIPEFLPVQALSKGEIPLVEKL